MATGENFKRINRKRDTRLEDALHDAKVKFTDYSKRVDDPNWSWAELWRLEEQVKLLEYQVWCEHYEYERQRRFWSKRT